MKIVGIGLVVAAAILAGCASTTTKQAAAPAPAPAPMTYQVKNMADFDSARKKAESECRSHYGTPAQYVERTTSASGDTVRFECKTKS